MAGPTWIADSCRVTQRDVVVTGVSGASSAESPRIPGPPMGRPRHTRLRLLAVSAERVRANWTPRRRGIQALSTPGEGALIAPTKGRLEVVEKKTQLFR